MTSLVGHPSLVGAVVAFLAFVDVGASVAIAAETGFAVALVAAFFVCAKRVLRARVTAPWTRVRKFFLTCAHPVVSLYDFNRGFDRPISQIVPQEHILGNRDFYYRFFSYFLQYLFAENKWRIT